MEKRNTRASLAEDFKKRIAVLRASLDALNKLLTPFLRVPLEIRLQIYGELIPRKRVVDVSFPQFYPILGQTYSYASLSPDHGAHPCFSGTSSGLNSIAEGDDAPLDLEDSRIFSADLTIAGHNAPGWDYGRNRNAIFVLSRQISDEALDVLHGENIFKLHLNGDGEYYLKKNFTVGNTKRMRHLRLIAQPRGVSYTPGKKPDDTLWRLVLPQLASLRVVAEQPIQPGGYYNAPALEEETDRWFKWITPFLECLGRYLSKNTLVRVDVDGRAMTKELFKRHLPHGFEEIQCHSDGDLIFERGQFSRESGYWDDEYPMSSRDVDWEDYNSQ
ncbi:hypothetical protein MANI_024487 [Metarhizium anisopliae]